MCVGPGGSDLELLCTHPDFLAKAVLWERCVRGGAAFANGQDFIESDDMAVCTAGVQSSLAESIPQTQEITCQADNRGRKR